MLQIEYDGTFSGFLTAIFYAFEAKTNDVTFYSALFSLNSSFALFGDTMVCETELDKAERVESGIKNKLGDGCYYNIYGAWRSHESMIEDHLFAYLKLCFKNKRNLSEMIQHPVVNKVIMTSKKVGRECHRFLGLLRFRRINDLNILVADFEPDFDILEDIAPHFIDRLNTERFIIRDNHYKKALIADIGRHIFIDLRTQELNIPETDDSFESMWCAYYKALTIKERVNPACQRNHMPKKYWKNLSEKQ